MTFLNKQGIIKIMYLGGITLALMGLVLMLIFGILIGRPYLQEKVLKEYECRTFNVTERGKQIACNTTEKSRDSRFPCYTVLAELALSSEVRNSSVTPPTRPVLDTTNFADIQFVSIYDNYETYAKFSRHDLHCSTFPCNVPPLQNQREAELFVKNYGVGKTFRCYFSGAFDGHAALLNRTIDELPVLQLMAWPAGSFIVGLLLITSMYFAVGCSIWEDTVMV